MSVYQRLRCPIDPAHGALYDWAEGKYGWFCGHDEHDGRPKSHPLGETKATRRFFTTAEAESGILPELVAS